MRHSSMIKMVFGLLPIASLVAVGFWLAYVTKYSHEKHQNMGANAHAAQEFVQKSTIAFQAVVATILVYFVSHHGLDQILRAV